ncbi:Gfo/Idh/MocA family oxidoreductase [Halostella sp. JP-L12]|uniref:Gfo/Idh/MocA family protein n=1 Tax=Halostella TaxID=1843185 RepID=UPI000EF8375E|nr:MULTISPECIES: Gfo/Idh/MocA family oxidoreductase [Halostella]NHN49746.1 Gfo/Idh/MocA family oxidoreductase [Halostella sp. JP-L12]
MKFGVLSTADIGRTAFVPGVRETEHEVLAIASRDGDRAAAVADVLGIERSYEGYDALLADDDLDAVYNPLPNAYHAEWTRRAADAGLHVLCEKPLGVDAAEAREMGEYCDERGVTLMEGYMYRYHPRIRRAIEIARTELDDVRSVTGRFTFLMPEGAEDIRLDPDLAGGSLRDVGVYPIHAARQILGEPSRVTGFTADTHDSGVDTEAAAVLEYDDGATAQVSSGFDTPKSQYVRVEAPNGWVEVEEAFNVAGETTLRYGVDGRTATETFEPVDQYGLEVEHFAECVASGDRPLTDAESGAATLRVIEAIEESAETGAAIDLD